MFVFTLIVIKFVYLEHCKLSDIDGKLTLFYIKYRYYYQKIACLFEQKNEITLLTNGDTNC